MTKAKQAKAPATVDKSKQLEVTDRPGRTRERLMTDVLSDGLVSNASAAMLFAKPNFGDLSITDMVASLREQGQRVNDNDLMGAEQMLTAQAVVLNAIFGELGRRAALNMGEYMGATETYLRLALKAQSQCRTTLETLATIKNPPVFTRQANIAHGPQQVNNGAPPDFPTSTRTHAHAHGTTGIEQSRLLEGVQHGGTLLDGGAAGTTARGNQALEPVAAVNRPEDGGR